MDKRILFLAAAAALLLFGCVQQQAAPAATPTPSPTEVQVTVLVPVSEAQINFEAYPGTTIGLSYGGVTHPLLIESASPEQLSVIMLPDRSKVYNFMLNQQQTLDLNKDGANELLLTYLGPERQGGVGVARVSLAIASPTIVPTSTPTAAPTEYATVTPTTTETPTPTPEPTPYCDPACLEPRKAEAYPAAPGVVSSTIPGLFVGQTWKVGQDGFLRVESIANDNSSAQISLWTRDDKGCRLFALMPVFPENYPKANFLFGDIEIVSYVFNGKVYADVSSGSSAYAACQQFSRTTYDCISLPGTGRYTLANSRFRRVFKQPNYAPAESILLDLSDLEYSRLLSKFPSLSAAYAPSGLWKITEFSREEIPFYADGFAVNGLIYAFADTAKIHEPFSTNATAYNYARATLNNTYRYWITSPMEEVHELGHALFYSTQAGVFLDSRYNILISEGLANYISIQGAWPEDAIKEYPNALNCGETTYGQEGKTYADNHEKEYIVGTCFYMLVEQACGQQAVSDAFAEVFDQPYHARDAYPHYFEMFEKHCLDKQRYRQILKNFGISDDVLVKQAPLANDLLPGDACVAP